MKEQHPRDGVSECAQAQYQSVVNNLTEEQLERHYPMACMERWLIVIWMALRKI